jgi:hypothetical protein
LYRHYRKIRYALLTEKKTINLKMSLPNNNSPITPNNNSPIIPVKVYSDAAASKEQILKENKGKSGVYLIFFC